MAKPFFGHFNIFRMIWIEVVKNELQEKGLELVAQLLPRYILAGCSAEILLEYSGEVLGIVKAERFGGFGNSMAILQQGFRALHKEPADIGRCAVAGACPHQITKVIGGKEQVLGTTAYGRNAVLFLQVFGIITCKEGVQPADETVRGALF